MNWTMLTISFLLGGVLSYIYFKGLWVTVNQVSKAEHPSTFIMVSFMIRSILLLICLAVLFWYMTFYAFASVISFIIVRQWMMIKHRPTKINTTFRKDNHA
jgi:F1F0 ATPase subunit 2